MTSNRAALHTTTVELSDGRTGHIVGYVAAFPHHPAPGTITTPIPGHNEPVAGNTDVYALVSVRWATEVTTIDVSTGHSVVDYVPGLLGTPRGTSWYLAPVAATPNGYAIIGGRANSGHTAHIPDIDGITDARTVNVHDFVLYRRPRR